MATVYLAIQENFQRQVAIKVMSPHLAQDPAFGERFQREARIVSQMNHPNIVTVYDVGVVDNCHYLAMQYIEGKELRHHLRDMPLPDKLKIIRDVASALNYAGNKGYVHRDVKPENVMVSDEDGRAILMDFGIAKASDGDHSMTKTGMAIGTPYYMSPEQAQGKPVDKRSDLYSLGVMFFHLLTGRVPYDAESGVAIGIKHVTEPVPLLPLHLRAFQPIIEKVMAKNPEQRYQSGAELIKDLDRIDMNTLDQVDRVLQEEADKSSRTDPHAQTVMAQSTVPPPTLAMEATARGSKRTSAKLPFVVVAMLAIAGVVAWKLQQQGEEPAPTSTLAQTAVGGVADAAPAPEPAPEVVNTEKADNASPADVATPTGGPPDDKLRATEAQLREAEQRAQQAEEQAQKLRAAEEKRLADEVASKAKERARQQAEMERQQQLALAQAKSAAEAKALAAQMEQQERDEIARRLQYAKTLHEKGALVEPAQDNAVLAYRGVLEIDPANTLARQAIDTIEKNYVLAIRTQLEQQQTDEAATQLRSAIRLYPDSAALKELQVLQEQVSIKKEQERIATSLPQVDKLVVNDVAFSSMELAQKNKLPLNRTAYVGFSYRNFQGATTLLQAILYDGARTLKIMQKPVVASGAEGKLFFSLARPVEGFPDGSYTVDLMWGDQRLASSSFSVGR